MLGLQVRGTTIPGVPSEETQHHDQLLAHLIPNARAPEAELRLINPGLIKGLVGDLNQKHS